MSVATQILIFMSGLTIGSFLNCLIWRLRAKESILGRSYCPRCKKQIAWYDNIPVLSFALLLGKCRHCGKPISWQYPAVELSTAVLFLTAFLVHFPIYYYPLNLLVLARDFFLIASFTVIFVYDLRWYLILDKVSLTAVAVVFILNFFIGFFSKNTFVNLENIIISGIIGAGFFLAQFVVSRGRWIGGGDIRLGLLVGLALGWPFVVEAIFIAYLMGSVIGVALIAFGQKSWGSKVPFGTFLSIAAIVVLFWGKELIDWYFTMLM